MNIEYKKVKGPMFIKLLYKITGKVQFRIIFFFIILGTISFFMGVGPSPKPEENDILILSQGLWRKIGLFCIITIFLFPALGVLREHYLANRIYNERIGDKKVDFDFICDFFNSDRDVMKKVCGQRIDRKKVLKMIKKYLIK